VLADDHHVVRQGLRALLEAETDFSVVGEAADGLEVAGLVVWLRYLAWSGEPAFLEAVRALRDARAARLIIGGGYLAPIALVVLARVVPAAAGPALYLAGALMLAGQLYAKTLVILKAGMLRPITLGALRLDRRLP